MYKLNCNQLTFSLWSYVPDTSFCEREIVEIFSTFPPTLLTCYALLSLSHDPLHKRSSVTENEWKVGPKKTPGIYTGIYSSSPLHYNHCLLSYSKFI